MKKTNRLSRSSGSRSPRGSFIGKRGSLAPKKSPRRVVLPALPDAEADELAYKYRQLLRESQQQREEEMQEQDVGRGYTLVKLLGKGGEGAVFLARHQQGGLRVLKRRVCPELEDLNAGLSECLTMSRVASRSTFVVQYEDVFVAMAEEGYHYLYIALEYCSGGDLLQLIVVTTVVKKVQGRIKTLALAE